MASRRIEIEIIGNSRSLESALGRATHRSNIFGKALRALAVVGFGAAVVGIEQSVKAALEAEKSQSRLQQAFKNSHLSLRTYERSLTATEKASRKLGFGDNDVRTSLGSLLTATDSYKRSLTLLSVAQNIARFKGVSLTDATKMLTMAMTGSQRATKALGLTISPVTTNVDRLKAAHKALTKEQQKATDATYKEQLAHAKLQDKLATGEAVIAAVTNKTKGFAEAYGKTAAGNIEHFKAEFEHLKAELGKGLLPILSAGTTKLTGFVSAIETHLPEIRAQFGGLAGAVGTAGKALLGFGSSKVGQSALAGLATTFVGSGLVGEVHSFVDLLKTMNPALIAVGVAGGIFGGVLYAIMTSTSGVTLELQKAKQAIDNLKDAQNNAAQAAQNVRAAHHQLTAAEIAHKEAIKNTAQALRQYGKDSSEYKRALNAEAISLDSVKQGHINVKNAGQQYRQTVVGIRDATKQQADALEGVRQKAIRLSHQFEDLTSRAGAYQSKATLARTGFISPQAEAAAKTYADAVAALTKKLGGTVGQAQAARKAVLALAQELGRLPTYKETKIFIRTFRSGETAAQSRGRPRQGNAAGGVVDGPPSSLLGPDTVLGALIPGEIVVNPARPERGLRALRAAGIEGFARGGTAKKKHHAPRLPKWIDLAEARARGTSTLTDDIAALQADERWTNKELGRKDLTASERRTLQKRRIGNKQKMTRFRTRQSNARQKDYSQLPASIRLKIARARNEHDNAKLLAALKEGEAWLKRQLNRKHLSADQQAAIWDALTSIEDEIASVSAEGTVDNSADLQAQLDQANARTGAAQRAADLANAFVNTGVFSGGGGSGGGGGGGGTMPSFGFYELGDSRMLRRATGAIVGGIGQQGHRPSTRERLGV